MYETLGLDLAPKAASVFFALGLGLAFGILAERTGFCFRRSVAAGPDRRRAAGVWAIALAVAVLGTQTAVAAGWITFDAHRFMAADLPILAIVLGGLMFGAGMILARGCISRLTVLSGTGNLRAALMLVAFAVVAHATLKGVLAPLRTSLGSVTVPLGEATSLAALPGGAWVWSALIVAAALAVAVRSGNRPLALLGGAAIGLLVPLAWAGTGFVLFDEFDPIAMESLSFTSPAADSLFYAVASTSIAPGFGVGLLGGTLLGALLASLAFRSFRWQSFEGPAQTGRYLAGAALMGTGGVLAGGCTLGAGLSGVPTLSVAALLAISAIAVGGLATDALLTRSAGESAGSRSRRGLQPAE